MMMWSRIAIFAGMLLFAADVTASFATAIAGNDYTKSAGGLTAYLGMISSEIIRGHPPSHPEHKMHGGPPSGQHQYHLIVSIFDTATGARISDAIVSAKISGIGLSGPEWALEPMQIADTTTYGAFVYLPGTDLYTIALTIRRPAAVQPAIVELKYDHRR